MHRVPGRNSSVVSLQFLLIATGPRYTTPSGWRPYQAVDVISADQNSMLCGTHIESSASHPSKAIPFTTINPSFMTTVERLRQP